ncbi:hypothetical protein VOM14_24080 [Paraburkholderia sp. MPAMCS5]|nr:hypothetical protein [Paraburkholderia sp. MPAMCS5]
MWFGNEIGVAALRAAISLHAFGGNSASTGMSGARPGCRVARDAL